MVLTAAILPPETLASWGLINRVLSKDRLASEGRDFAEALAHGPTRAYATTKQLLHTWRSGGVTAADQVSKDLGPGLMQSEDLQNGIVSLQQDGPGHAVFNGR
jgi:enoyl-CoA hydratase/carnithine racemase